MAGTSGGCCRRNADGPALSLPNRRRSQAPRPRRRWAGWDDARPAWVRSRNYPIEHLLAGQVQGPAVNDVPSWAMLADRSNNTRTSGLVVHDIAGLNVCDSRTSPPKALVHVERGLCPVPPGRESGVSWQRPDPVRALWWRQIAPRTCGPTTKLLSDIPRALDRQSVDRRDKDRQELVLARGGHSAGPARHRTLGSPAVAGRRRRYPPS